MSTELEKKMSKERVRKPRARHRDIVLGCIEERLSMMKGDAAVGEHVTRLFDLFDELRRALGGKKEEEASE